MYTIKGCDISFWQDNPATPRQVDFSVMRDAGASFVIIRAGQNTWADSDFAYNWRESKGKLLRGSYWFYDSRSSPQSQARLWINTLGNDKGELPLFADFEENYNGAYRGITNFRKFVEEVKRIAPNKEVFIYTSFGYWRRVAGINPVELAYWKQYKLWIANYNTTQPLVPAPWTTWDFWQYADNGDGIKYGTESARVDMNYYNGTKDQFEARFGAIIPPVVVPPAPVMIHGTVKGTVNIRNAPLGIATGRYLMKNDVIEADTNKAQWLHITKINGVDAPADSWASAGAFQQYITWAWTDVYPPVTPPSNVTAALEKGRAATLVTDPFSKRWGYKPRRPGPLAAYPQTAVFNHIAALGKGKRLPLTLKVIAAVLRLNGLNAFRLWIPSAGWINNDNETPTVDKVSPTSERLTWSANHVIILEQSGNFYRVYADDCNNPQQETFFTKNGRFIVHKYNAIHKDGHMLKYGKGLDLYTPFTSDGEMWIPVDEVYLWPALPFQLGDGTYITRYEVQGFKYYGIRADGTTVLLRDETGYKTNWTLKIPEVPQ
jgi:lysozyme